MVVNYKLKKNPVLDYMNFVGVSLGHFYIEFRDAFKKYKARVIETFFLFLVLLQKLLYTYSYSLSFYSNRSKIYRQIKQISSGKREWDGLCHQDHPLP